MLTPPPYIATPQCLLHTTTACGPLLNMSFIVGLGMLEMAKLWMVDSVNDDDEDDERDDGGS